MKLKNKLKNNEYYNVELKYSTPRGKWYFTSWKGQKIKSGGILMNIGVHLFDLLLWLFDFKFKSYKLHSIDIDNVIGELYFDNAHVKWELSLKQEDTDNGKPYRRLLINDEKIRFDKVFEDLHQEIYKYALEGKGFGIEDCRPAIELIHKIRTENNDIEKDYFNGKRG
jgi:UDP-N-acetyl-2-amino-2-deoxyglucuronate dehydrogenase